MTFLRAGDPGVEAAHRAGRLARVVRGLYTDDLTTPLLEQVERDWRQAATLLVPRAVVTARSGPMARPVDGVLFVAGGRARPLVLPGLTIVNVSGPGQSEGDVQLADGLWWASEARILVDNARVTRSIDGRPPATLTRTELHDHIARLVANRTSKQIDRLIDAVTKYAAASEQVEQGEAVAVFVASARGECPTVETDFRAMRAAQVGRSVDSDRLKVFRTTAQHLADTAPQILPGTRDQPAEAFFEAYFSNFIEGTEFTVAEAHEIVVGQVIPRARPEDAHDVLGTYKAIIDPELGDAVSIDADGFVELLRARHRLVMEGRPNVNPGVFKDRANRAGTTEFVAPHLVQGTLSEGWGIGQSLIDPFARAVFMMFMVSEVHPFADGNGRVARLSMNAELTDAAETRIVIPTILRTDYMSALVKTTTHAQPSGLVAVLGHARRHTAQTDYSTFERAERMLSLTNAFVDARDAERSGLRLELPSSLDPRLRYEQTSPPRAGGPDPG